MSNDLININAELLNMGFADKLMWLSENRKSISSGKLKKEIEDARDYVIRLVKRLEIERMKIDRDNRKLTQTVEDLIHKSPNKNILSLLEVSGDKALKIAALTEENISLKAQVTHLQQRQAAMLERLEKHRGITDFLELCEESSYFSGQTKK